MDDITGTWLKSIGAVRPMTPTGTEAYVLGQYEHGEYPLYFTRNPRTESYFDVYHYGHKVECKTQQDVLHLMTIDENETRYMIV